jgi:Lipocalin-like domain
MLRSIAKGASKVKLIAALILSASLGFCVEINPLIGSWKVVSWTDTPDKGKPYFPFGTNPTGEFVFAPDGHFSARVVSGPVGPLPAALPPKGFDDLIVAGVVAPCLEYSGTYTADLVEGTLNYELEGANAPVYILSDNSRMIRFDGDRLILTGQAIRADGNTWTFERILVRERVDVSQNQALGPPPLFGR